MARTRVFLRYPVAIFTPPENDDIESESLLAFEHTEYVMTSNILAQGERIGQYKIVRELGRGSYGCVYKAEEEQTGGFFALKMLHGKPTQEQKDALRKEAIVQSGLVHKNIVRCFHFVPDEPKGPYLVLEYVDGYSLQDILEGKSSIKIDFLFANRIIKSCLEGLAFAHTYEKGIVHGDVKPGNILVPADEAVEPKLGDFGVARILGTEDLLKKGSAICAAPEFLKNWKQEKKWTGDYQCDLFSVGVIAYCLVTGRHPFIDLLGLGRSVSDFVEDDSFKAPPLVRLDGMSVPKGFEAVISSLLEKKRSKRCGSAREALNSLAHVDLSSSVKQEQKDRKYLAGDIKVVIDFSPAPTPEVDLDLSKCTYELREGTKVVKRGKIPLAMTPGGWQCELPPEVNRVEQSQTIRLNLVEKNGKDRWEVKPFYPFVIAQKATRVK